MRTIIFSDSHGEMSYLRQALALALEGGTIDQCVHLGDGMGDFAKLDALLTASNFRMRRVTISGNNDFDFFGLSPMQLVDLGGGIMALATHGHRYHVRQGVDALVYAAQQHGCQAALYGHTHLAEARLYQGVWVINPGAICEKRSGLPAFAEIVTDEKGHLTARLVKWP